MTDLDEFGGILLVLFIGAIVSTLALVASLVPGSGGELLASQTDSNEHRVVYERVHDDIDEFVELARGTDRPTFSIIPSDAQVITTSLRGAYKEAVNNARELRTLRIDRRESERWLVGLDYTEIEHNTEMVLPVGGLFILEERVIQESDGSYFAEVVIGKLKESPTAINTQETPNFECERYVITDHNGNQAAVDFITLSGNKRWAYASSEAVVDDGDGSVVDMAQHLDELSGPFSESKGVIVIGMASQEGGREPNNKLSDNRAESLQDWTRPILGKYNTNVGVRRLNLGQYMHADLSLSKDETSEQRRVVLISVVTKHPNADLESALERWFLEEQDDLSVDIRDYSNYEYGEGLDLKLF